MKSQQVMSCQDKNKNNTVSEDYVAVVALRVDDHGPYFRTMNSQCHSVTVSQNPRMDILVLKQRLSRGYVIPDIMITWRINPNDWTLMLGH